jgi:DNA-binding MarR family transcriptional regulator
MYSLVQMVTRIADRQVSDAEAEAFLSAFDAFAQAVRRARGVPAGPPRALTLSQFGLLELLRDQDSARVRDLAEHAGVSPPTATRILDTLERRGLVRRRQSPEDRRGVSVTLTDPGRQALGEQHAWLRSCQRTFYGELQPGERELAPTLLVGLADLIDEMAAGPER